jgi:tetratricopeptide (TPR) repeat protein
MRGGSFPNRLYILKHSLTTRGCLRLHPDKRKTTPAKIAETIEEAFKEDLCYHYGILANHCIASENHGEGAGYAYLEARRYQKAALFKDAIGYARMSVSSLEKLPQTEANRKKLIDARTALAIYNLSLNYMVEAKDAVAPVMDQVLKMNYQKSLPAIYVTMGTYCLGVEEDFPKGIDYLNKAIKISEEVGDAFSLWMACSQLGIFLPHFCEFNQALTYCNKCVELSKLAKNPLGISISKAYLTYMHTLRGEISSACQSCQELLSSFEEYGDPYIKGTVYSHYGGALYYKGMFEEAEKYLLEGLTFCNKTFQVGWESIATARLGFMSFDRGSYRKAQDYHLQAIRILEGVKMHPSWGNVQKTCLAKARVRANDRDVNLAELFEYHENNKMRSYEGFMARNIGDVMLHLDDNHFPDAETWIQKAIGADTRNGARWQLARYHALYAEWFKKKGDTSRANDRLHQAIDIFKECGADGWTARIQESLVELA